MTDTTEAQAIAALAKNSWNLIGIKNTAGKFGEVILSHLHTGLMFFVFLLFFSVPVTCFAKEVPVLTLSSSGMADLGSYPTYRFEIYEDGTVYYRGEINVNVIGERHANITPHQVQQLIATYKAIDTLFNHFKTSDRRAYEAANHCRCPELFRLQYQDEISEIRPGGFSRDMFVNLNKMTPVKNWICFDKGETWDCPVEPRQHTNLYPIN